MAAPRGTGHGPARMRRAPGIAAALVLAATVGCAEPEPRMLDVVELTIAELHDALLSGETTCRLVVDAHLERIEVYEDTLNALTVVNGGAYARADSLDARIQAGEELGPLFCVPVLVKDNFDTHDLVTTGGSVALAGSVPPDDAFMVERIRAADAIVLAKTNMAEWAFSPRQTVSSSFDTTRNAYALDRVPAGSSGGTASGVAASFGVVGLGSDTGNSIRGPSSHLALVGIRSTLGLTSRDGVIPLSFDRDVAGPMGRTVEDVARVFDVVAGYDPKDPYTEAGRGRRAEDYTAFLDTASLQGARLAVVRELVDEDADSAVVRLFEEALDDLEALGAEIVDPFAFDLDAQRERRGMFCQRFRYDMARYLESLGEDAPIRDVIEVLETGEHAAYVEGGLRSFSRYPADVHPSAWDPPCPDFGEHPERQAFLAELVAAMDAASVDALVYPSWRHPPAPLDRAREEYRGDNSQFLAPATGTPAITVPMGFTYGTLPAGLQMLARPYDDGRLLGYAYAYEQATGHRRPPAGFPPLARAEADDEVAPGGA